MTDAAPDGPAAVVGQRVVVTDRVRALRILAVCALTSYWMWRGRYEWLLYPAVLVALQVRVVKQPPSVVSATGIIRPWRRRSYVDWNEVESVAPPDPGRRGCMLNLANGKSLSLSDIPADQAVVIAALGGKEVRAPSLPSRPSAPNRPRSDIEIEADVRRQAQALALQRQQLAAESKRLRGAGR